MADVRIAPQKTLQGGAAVTRTGSLSVSDTYLFRNDGKTVLHFRKSGAGIAAIAVITPGSAAGLAISDQAFNVPASTGDVIAGPFPPSVFNDENGDAKFTASDIAGLDVAVLQV